MGRSAALGAHAAVRRAAEALREAEALLVCTGAGMGVDSGFSTFRGRHAGVWPPLKALDIDYASICSPGWFASDPHLAWAFWHFCYQAYTKGKPHDGYGVLSKWGSRMDRGFFSVTSNIDGHWLRTEGVRRDRVYEVHGAVTHMQGLASDSEVWPTDESALAALKVPRWDLGAGEEVQVHVDLEAHGEWRRTWVPALLGEDGCCTSRRGEALPSAPHAVRRPGGPDLCRAAKGARLPCSSGGAPARPNVMMFGDRGMSMRRVDGQRRAFEAWTSSLAEDARLVIVEVGAGMTVSTIRELSEGTAEKFPRSVLVRINLDDCEVPASLGSRALSIGGLTALEALAHLDRVLAHACQSLRGRRSSSAPPSMPQLLRSRGGASSGAARCASPGPWGRRGGRRAARGLSRGFAALLAERRRQRQAPPAALAPSAGPAARRAEGPGEAGAWLCTDEGGMPRGACRGCESCEAFAHRGHMSIGLAVDEDGEEENSSEEESEESDEELPAPAASTPLCQRCGCPAPHHRPLRKWLKQLQALVRSLPSQKGLARCRLPVEAAEWPPDRALAFALQAPSRRP